jgi:hypothetical protein
MEKPRDELISIYASIHQRKRKEPEPRRKGPQDNAFTHFDSGLAGQLEFPSPPSSESRFIGASCEPVSDLSADVDGAEEGDQSRLKEFTRDIYIGMERPPLAV